MSFLRRKLFVLVVSGVLVALGATTATAVTRPMAKCSISGLHVSAAGIVTPVGACRSGKSSVSPAWDYSYRLFDSAGYACGAEPVSGKALSKSGRFHIDSNGADHAVLTVRLKAQHGRSRSAVKRFGFNLVVPAGSDPASCGTLDDVTATTSQLCPWVQPWPGMEGGAFLKCGKLSSLARLATAMTFTGGTVALGHPVTAGGSCHLSTQGFPRSQTEVSYDWQGVHYQGQNLWCDDGLFAFVNAITIGVVNNQGMRCYQAPVTRVWSFQIPADWGGKQLFVEAAVGILDTKQKYAVHEDLVAQTGTFSLNPSGTVDPCTVLKGRAPGNG